MESKTSQENNDQLRSATEVHSHADCAYCNGDEKACARQANLELRFEPLIQGVENFGEALELKAKQLKQVIKPEGAHTSGSNRLTLSSGKGQHLVPKPSYPREALGKLQFSPRKAVAASLIASSSLSPVAPMLGAEAQPVPAVAAADISVDQLPLYDFSPEAVVDSRPVPVASVEVGHNVYDVARVEQAVQPEVEAIKQPLIVTLHDGQGVVDVAEVLVGPEVSKNDRNQVFLTTAKILSMNGYPEPQTIEDLNNEVYKTIPAGQELKVPVETSGLEFNVVEKGETLTSITAAFGLDSEDRVAVAQFNGVIDWDNVYKGQKIFLPPQFTHLAQNEPTPATPVPADQPDNPTPVLPNNTRPQVTAPEQTPKPDTNLDEPPHNDQLIDIATRLNENSQYVGQVVLEEQEIMLENSRRMSKGEASQALNLLIQAIHDYENPMHDTALPIMEHEPTPQADRLRSNREELIDNLASGETNLAYIQSETLRRLATGTSGQVDVELMQGIANHLVRYIAERNAWLLVEDEATTLTEMVLRGVQKINLQNASWSHREAVGTADTIDELSLSIDLYDASLQGHLDEQVEFARLAEQQLELLRSNMRDLSDVELVVIAQEMVRAKQNGEPVNDYSYEVFKAKLGEQANESVVLKLLGRQLYAARQSDDLLELFPDAETKIAEAVDGWLVAEGPKNLTALLEVIDGQIDERVAGIMERGTKLQELERDLDELYPALVDLSGQEVYELAKAILSAEANEQSIGDDWLLLAELKTSNGGSMEETAYGLIEGIYRAQGADLLLSTTGREQDAVVAAIELFMSGEDKNLKTLLDAQFNSLEQRLSEAEAGVTRITELVSGVVSDYDFDDNDILDMTIKRIMGQTDQELVDEIVNSFEAETGRELSPEQTSRIGIELIRIQTPDQAERVNKFSQHLLDFYNGREANFYLSGADDPAIITLARMVEKGEFVISYPEGDVSILSEAFMDKLRAYDTIPSSLFPGQQWLIKGYAGQDLAPFFNRLGFDADQILASPYNSHITVDGDRMVTDGNGAIWFSAELWAGKETPDFEAAVDWAYGEIPGLQHKVVEGQTLSKIASMFRVNGKEPDWNDLVKYNRGRISSDPTELRIGQIVAIPTDWRVYIDLDYPDIEVSPGNSNEAQPQSEPETIPADAKVAETSLGSLGTIQIVQMNDTFETSKEMNPTAVINHWTGGDYDDTNPLENFLNGIRSNTACDGGCSVHFFISEQGTIYQLSDLDSRLAHARGANSFGVGIEIEGAWGNDDLPNDTQYQAALKLNAYLIQELGLSTDHSLDNKSGILGHYEVDGSHLDPDDSGKTDPGKRFLQQIRNDIDAWANPVAVEVSEPSSVVEEPVADQAPETPPAESAQPEVEATTNAFPENAPSTYRSHKVLQDLSDNFWNVFEQKPSLEYAIENYNSSDPNDTWGPELKYAEDVARLAYAAGFRGEDLVIAVAVAHPESGLHPYVIGDYNLHYDGDMSVGKYQNYASPARGWEGGARDPADNLDPLHNVQSAYEIWTMQGWEAWSSFKSGNHVQYLDEARQAVANAGLNQ